MTENKSNKWVKNGPRLIEETEMKGSTPWVDGYYLTKKQATNIVDVQGENIIIEAHTIKKGDPIAKGTWKQGEFGEADPAVAEASGKKVNNWQMEAWGGMGIFKGVLSDDGKKVTFVNFFHELDFYEWMSNEELAAFQDSFDPADSPPSHYKLQPDIHGKFLFITGPPGLGKSTTGLLLSKKAGYVYYEGDCFMHSTNPYISPDKKEPSLEIKKQMPLKGLSPERIDAIPEAVTEFRAMMMQGKQFNVGIMKKFYSEMAKDITKERKRLGGDWAVAQAVPSRELRDFMREQLGPYLTFVVLNMEKEDQIKRIEGRYGENKGNGGFDINTMLKNMYDMYEPAGKDEPNTIGLNITADMSREDVVEKILKLIGEKV